MKDTELVAALRQLKVNTKSSACLGCNYGFNCSSSGCRLIGLAADRLNEVGIILSIVRGMHAEAKDAEKSLLGIVLSLFDRYYKLTPGIQRDTIPDQKSNPCLDIVDSITYAWNVTLPRKWFTDFELCADTKELAQTLQFIDKHGYTMVSATQDASGVYTVFFRRPARE